MGRVCENSFQLSLVFCNQILSQAIEDSEIIKSYGGVFWKDFFNEK